MSKYRHELVTLRIAHSQLGPCLVHEGIMLVVSNLMTADSSKNHFINVSFLGLDQASDSGKNVSFLGTNEASVINNGISYSSELTLQTMESSSSGNSDSDNDSNLPAGKYTF